MPTYVHLVRHAQGVHNLSTANHRLPDPDLTPLGKDQCAALQASFPLHAQVTHLAASPLRRTLYTCLLSFAPAIHNATGNDKPKRVIALPDLQEVSPLPCDTGSSPAALAGEFPAEQVDLTALFDGWNDKSSASSPFAPVMERLEARARAARVWMREAGRAWEAAHPGKDAHVVAVTHGGFLHFLTQDWDGLNPAMGTGWENAEWRSYEFVEGSEGKGDEEARLRETAKSWRRRRGSEIGLTETEQMELRAACGEKLREEWGGELEGDKTQAAVV